MTNFCAICCIFNKLKIFGFKFRRLFHNFSTDFVKKSRLDSFFFALFIIEFLSKGSANRIP